MFSSHGTEEEENDYTHDEERRRQLREDVLEGLKIGDDEGEGADHNAVDKNVNAAVPASLTDRLPTFSPRKNQAFRNTFGFIAPGGSVPTLPAIFFSLVSTCAMRQPKLKLHCRKAPNFFCFIFRNILLLF